MQFSDVSIVTPTALYVQMLEAENAPVKKQVRIKRDDIASDALSPEMRGWVAISRVVAARVAQCVFLPCAGASGGMCCAR
jgi:hypothetical protein